MVALQWHVRTFPGVRPRGLLMASSRTPPSSSRSELLVVPAEVGLSAHARSRSYCHRPGLEIPGHDAGLQELHGGSRIDVAFQLTTDDDFPARTLPVTFAPGSIVTSPST